MTAATTGCRFCIDGLMPAGRCEFMGELFEHCPSCRTPCTSCDGIAVLPASYDDSDDLVDDLRAFALAPIFCSGCTGVVTLVALSPLPSTPTHSSLEATMTTPPANPTGPFDFTDPWADTTTEQASAAHLTEAITDVQAQMGRVDTKAAMLLAGAIAALSAGIAVIAKAHLSTAATIGAISTLILLGAAVALLFTAVRPALRGNHGFVRFAQTNPADLLVDLALTDSGRDLYQANRLHSLSVSVLRKYRVVRAAVDLLRAALVNAALTALLAALI